MLNFSEQNQSAYLVMSVLENSFTSQRDSPSRVTRHPLNLDLQQLGVKFESDELNQSKDDTQSGKSNSILSPDQDKQNKIENQPQLLLHNKSTQSFHEEVYHQQQPNETPKTIVLIEDELAGKSSIYANSRFSQYSMEVENQSFGTFLNIKKSNYDTVVKNFQILFEKVANLYEERNKNITQTYLSFIKIKYNQQKLYLKVNIGQIENNKKHIIYINCKTAADEIRNKLESEKNAKKQYVRLLRDIKNRMQKHIEAIDSEVREKRNKIKQILKAINQIGNQMSDLMIPQNRKDKKDLINPQIYSNSFIRTKYLIGKQKIYLSLISVFLQKVLNLISFICLEVEPKNCLVVKQSMLGFMQCQCMINPHAQETLNLKIQKLLKTNCYDQIYKQISKKLESFIPQKLNVRDFNQDEKQYGEKLLKTIIQGLISESQSLVYLPVIELQNKDYAYHSKNKASVKWIKVNHQQKYLSETIQQLDTYVILTHQGHLILQLTENNKSQQKMAILKLNQIKMSRKNNQIILIDRGKGMIGYLFATNAVLGSLIFEPLNELQRGGIEPTENDLIQEFIQRARDVLEQKKCGKIDKNNVQK